MIHLFLLFFFLERRVLCGKNVIAHVKMLSNFICDMGNLNCLSDLCRALYWVWAYGGYSGDLSPESTLELLSGKDNALLIDVRPEARYCKICWSIYKLFR